MPQGCISHISPAKQEADQWGAASRSVLLSALVCIQASIRQQQDLCSLLHQTCCTSLPGSTRQCSSSIAQLIPMVAQRSCLPQGKTGNPFFDCVGMDSGAVPFKSFVQTNGNNAHTLANHFVSYLKGDLSTKVRRSAM